MNPSDLAATLVASLAGSLHCAAMCGPFLPLLQGEPVSRSARSSRATRLMLYHAGRGFAYLSLGLAAGSLSRTMQASADSLLLQRILAVVMALGLVFAALRMAWPRKRLVQLKLGSKKSPLHKVRAKIFALREQGQGELFSLALGLASALLPCGWLWSYVWLAGTRSNPWAATATMAAFWLGTLPALTLLGALSLRLRERLGHHTPKLGALALFGIAAWTLYERWPAPQHPEHCQALAGAAQDP